MAKRGSGFTSRDPNFLERAAEALRRWAGEGRDPEDAVVTRRDFRKLTGRVTSNVDLGSRLREAIKENSSGGGSSDEPFANAEKPKEPTGVKGNVGVSSATLTWDNPSYAGHASTEVWRHTEDEVGNASLIAMTTTPAYSDATAEAGVTYYYWLRHRNVNGRTGPFHATSGVELMPGVSQEKLLDALTNEIVDTEFFEELSAGAGVFESTEDGKTYYGIAADRFVVMQPDASFGDASDLFPFLIDEDGKVWIDEVGIREAAIDSTQIKEVNADKVNVDKLSAISADLGEIEGGSLDIGDGKFQVNSDGDTTIRSSSTGERLEIYNNVIKVYDTDNNLRVQIGDLNA